VGRRQFISSGVLWRVKPCVPDVWGEYPVKEDGAAVVPGCVEFGVELEHSSSGCEIEGILGPVFYLFLVETMSLLRVIQGCMYSL